MAGLKSRPFKAGLVQGFPKLVLAPLVLLARSVARIHQPGEYFTNQRNMISIVEILLFIGRHFLFLDKVPLRDDGE